MKFSTKEICIDEDCKKLPAYKCGQLIFLATADVLFCDYMKKSALFVAPVALLLLMGSGCGSSAPVTTADGSAASGVTPSSTSPTATVSTPVAATGSDCTSEYFPLRTGYQISFANRLSTGASQNTYTMKVTSVVGSHVTATVDFDSGIHSEQAYDCTDGNVQATGYVDLGAGMSGVHATAVTRSSSGQLIPHDVHVGSVWTAAFTISTSLGGVSGMPARNIDSTVTTERTAEAEEDVTVPAGTFHALKVKSITTFTFAGAAPSIPGMGAIPAPAPVVGYEWWVKGKGMVKTTSDMSGTSIVSEATSILTP